MVWEYLMSGAVYFIKFAPKPAPQSLFKNLINHQSVVCTGGGFVGAGRSNPPPRKNFRKMFAIARCNTKHEYNKILIPKASICSK